MKIRVSNLDRSTEKEDIFKLFEEFGDVEHVRLIVSANLGHRDTCAALVEMSDDLDAEEAIKELNGELFDGKVIRVRAEMSEGFIDNQEDSADDWDKNPNESQNWERIQRKRPNKENAEIDKRKGNVRRERR